jgi:hypothetical protein
VTVMRLDGCQRVCQSSSFCASDDYAATQRQSSVDQFWVALKTISPDVMDRSNVRESDLGVLARGRLAVVRIRPAATTVRSRVLSSSMTFAH